MVASNLVPYTLAGGSPDWFRFYGTFAAPLFVFLAGMMVRLTGQLRQRNFGYYAIRGLAVVLVGACIDAFVWGLVPFVSMDVLYLIGLAMPLCYLLGTFPIVWRYVITIAIFAMMPLLQAEAGYRYAPNGFMLQAGLALDEIISQAELAQGWFIDGWFPVFPWLGVAFAGFLVGDFRIKYPSFANSKVLIAALGTLATGAWWWQAEPIERFAREGYPDLFYPPTLAFFCIAAGVLSLLFCIIDHNPQRRIYTPFKLYGKCSLLMYALHVICISEFFVPLNHQGIRFPFAKFILLYLGLMTILLCVAFGLSKLKPKRLPAVVRFFVGG
jgi:uncharacterized membrane protein